MYMYIWEESKKKHTHRNGSVWHVQLCPASSTKSISGVGGMAATQCPHGQNSGVTVDILDGGACSLAVIKLQNIL